MEKDTKTFRCDGCKKTIVLDFYNDSTAETKASVEKELIGWINIRLSATRRSSSPNSPSLGFIPDTVGHACSDKCVEDAIHDIIRRKMPEQLKR